MPIVSFDNVQFWLLLIPVLAGAIISVLNSMQLKRVPVIESTLGEVHAVVNGVLAQERAENALLRTMLAAKQLELDAQEKTRAVLAIETSAMALRTAAVTAAIPMDAETTASLAQFQKPEKPTIIVP